MRTKTIGTEYSNMMAGRPQAKKLRDKVEDDSDARERFSSAEMDLAVELLECSDSETRRHASRAIERVASWNESTTRTALPATESLIQHLDDSDKEVRDNCVDALSMIAHSFPRNVAGAVSEIVNVTRDPYWQVRCGAVRALRPIADRSPQTLRTHISKITPLLDDDDWRVRRDAAVLLGKIGSQDVITELTQVYENDSSDSVQSAAEEAIREIQYANWDS